MSLLSFVSARRGVVPVLAAALAVTLAPRAVRAQYTIDQRAGTQRRGPRFTVGGGVEYAQPVSQFRQNVDHGFGGGGWARLHVDPAGVLSLRADVHYVNYGNHTQYFGASTILGFVNLEETTSNNIIVATIGPQLSVPTGPIRPYVNGAIGFAHFYTETALKDQYDQTTLAQSTNYSDNSLVYTGGAGLYIPLVTGQQTVALDVGARYNAIGTTRYLAKGDIQSDPTTQYGIVITPHESDARFVTYHLGAAITF